ncbi:MAG: LysM domain-containing protein [Chloroflexota bacterium]
MDKKLMGNFRRSSLIYLLFLTIFLAVILAACEIPSPTAQDPQPVDVVEGDVTPEPEESEPVISETLESDASDQSDDSADADAVEDSASSDSASSDSDSESEGDEAMDEEMAADESGDDAPEQPETDTNQEAAAYPDPEEDPTDVPATATETSEEVTPVPSATEVPEEGDEDSDDSPTATSTATPTAAPSATPTPAPSTEGSGGVTGTEILHTVQPGENLYRIGLQYNISWTVLQIYNGLPNANALQVGQVIRIPVVPEAGGPATSPDSGGITPTPSTAVVHNVMPGETLFSIGLRYGFDWNQIAEANGIMNPMSLKAGQQIKIPVEVVRDANELQHVIQTGESLFTISLQYGVPWSAIASRNNVFYPYTIYPNEGLIIPGLSSQ